MAMPVGKIAAELLRDIEKRKTAECLNIDTLGEYIDRTLPGEEWDKVEGHLRSCLYCLNELVELRELLLLEKKAEPLPRSLERRLRRLAAQKRSSIWERFFEAFRSLLSWPSVQKEEVLTSSLRLRIPMPSGEATEGSVKGYATSVLETTRTIFSSRYTWQTVSGLSLAAVLFMYFGVYQRGPAVIFSDDTSMKVAATVSDSVVAVRGMDSNRVAVRQGVGVVVERGFVLLPLHLVTGIASGEVTLASGVSLPIKGLIGADPESDLAVVELDTSSTLKSLRLADLGTMQAGDPVVAISQTDRKAPQVANGVLGDVIPLNPRTKVSREIEPRHAARQFIRVDSTEGGTTQAILVNVKGEVVSVNTVSPEGEKVGLAMSIDNIKSIIEASQTPIPLGELKYKSHPPEAVLYYVRGILTYNSGNIHEAINYYQKCLKIDYGFDRAHEELGGMYFLKGDYEKEKFHYNEAVRLNPENIDARAYLAQAYEDEGRYDLAIREFELLLAIKPTDEEARYNLGIDYLVTGRLEKAREQYEALKKIHESAANKLKRLIDLALPPQRQPAV